MVPIPKPPKANHASLLFLLYFLSIGLVGQLSSFCKEKA